MDLGHYSFIPWVRQGIANSIDPVAPTGNRPSINVFVKINDNEHAVQSVDLQGPGDVIGIQERAIIRTVPQNWETDFEPYLLPCIEFYDEDLPWRYSPASAATYVNATSERLNPWLFLLVLEEGEFKDTEVQNAPLNAITLEGNASIYFPDHTTNWAWAHVHVNHNLFGSGGTVGQAPNRTMSENFLNGELLNNKDQAFSRIVSPRKLDPNKAYHAFLIPAYENGRKAGIGEAATAISNQVSWINAAGSTVPDLSDHPFPYYYRWYFRTGIKEDFEYQVRQLEPRILSGQVEGQKMDLQRVGFGINYSANSGTVSLEGALKPAGTTNSSFPDINNEFKKQVFYLLNYKEDRKISDGGSNPYFAVATNIDASASRSSNGSMEPQQEGATYDVMADSSPGEVVIEEPVEPGSEVYQAPYNSQDLEIVPEAEKDPVIVPPTYGRWHAAVSKLSGYTLTATDNSDNWIHQLNLDPRYRAVAGVGSRIIQDKQDEYMQKAWTEVEDILKANQNLNQANLAVQANESALYRKLIPATNQIDATSSGNIAARMAGGGEVGISTSNYTISSFSDQSLTMMAPIFSRVRGYGGKTLQQNIVESRLPKAVFSSGFRRISRPLGKIWASLNSGREGNPENPWVSNSTLLSELQNEEIEAAGPKILPDSDAMHQAETTTLVSELESLKAQVEAGGYPEGSLLTNGNFRDAVINFIDPNAFIFEEAPVQEPLDIEQAKTEILEATVPSQTMLKRFDQSVYLVPKAGSQINDGVGASTANGVPQTLNSLKPIMAYPQFKQPMYETLRAYNEELLLPGIGSIPQNTVALLEVNQPFIEAFMVGLNHEMAAELLWREYPTDQRGSYFRQFWDVKDYLAPQLPTTTPAALEESLKDIIPIHRWNLQGTNRLLGQNNNRTTGDGQLMLLIKGEPVEKVS